MQKIVAVAVSILFTVTLAASPLLDRGKEAFRAGKYADAVEDLRAAAAAALAPEARQAYVATGKLASLSELEESLVYLALAYDRIGREAEARDAVTRLLNAERIQPTYASLPLTADAAGFEEIAAKLVPSIALPANGRLQPKPGEVIVQPTLAQQRAELMNLVEERVAAARAEIEKSANERVAAAQRAADERVAAETAAAQKRAEERVAAESAAAAKAAEEKIAAGRAAATRAAEERLATERAAAEKRADERIAAERAAATKDVESRIAAERAAAEKRAEERVAAERSEAQRDLQGRLAAARAEVEKAAEQKLAAERAAMQKLADERIGAERAAAEKEAQERISAAEGERRRVLLATLRHAETLAVAGNLDEANHIYTTLAASSASTREAIAAAAAGLYRIGAFDQSVTAFTRLGPLARGEDDLRYYHAVALYETGHFAEAKAELAAALPNLKRTDDVERYRAKIEQAK